VLTPGGLEGYLREVARLGTRPDTAGFDIEFV
jgi:hypothetical protein